MAPEVQNKNFSQTYKGLPADIFSMGVILWTMHFGMAPFNSTRNNDRNYSILQRNQESLWRLHPSVRKWGT